MKWQAWARVVFVQYSPLFFFSALCFLTGVFLVGRAMGARPDAHARLSLAAITQAYELLLVAGAAFLFARPGGRRPAVILALLELPFLFDCTFQSEFFATLGRKGVLPSSLWLAAFFVKAVLLTRALRLRLPARALGIATLAAAGIAAGPHLLDARQLAREDLHVVLLAYGTVVAALARGLLPALLPKAPLSEWGDVVLRRAVRTCVAVAALVYVAHAGVWLFQFDVRFTPATAAPILLLAPLVTDRERRAWGTVAATFVLATPSVVAPVACTAAFVLVVLACRSRRPRLLAAALVCADVALWLSGWAGGPLPPTLLVREALVVLMLAAVAWRGKSPVAATAAVVVAVVALRTWAPSTTLEWGYASLTAAFASLIAGVGVSLRPAPEPSSEPKV